MQKYICERNREKDVLKKEDTHLRKEIQRRMHPCDQERERGRERDKQTGGDGDREKEGEMRIDINKVMLDEIKRKTN